MIYIMITFTQRVFNSSYCSSFTHTILNCPIIYIDLPEKRSLVFSNYRENLIGDTLVFLIPTLPSLNDCPIPQYNKHYSGTVKHSIFHFYCSISCTPNIWLVQSLTLVYGGGINMTVCFVKTGYFIFRSFFPNNPGMAMPQDGKKNTGRFKYTYKMGGLFWKKDFFS
jgi:hypothetical protein